MVMAAQVFAVVSIMIGCAAWSLRTIQHWVPVEEEQEWATWHGPSAGALPGSLMWVGAVLVWLAAVGLPVVVMGMALRDSAAWRQGFALFAREWGVSLMVSAGVALGAVAVTVATLLVWRTASSRWVRGAAACAVAASFLAAMVPPAALGIGFITFYNGFDVLRPLYLNTPLVWILSLATRYTAVAMVIVWPMIGWRSILILDQARTDGAATLEILTDVLLPWAWPSLLAAGAIVGVLSLFEVVLTQMVGPVGFPSIALTILGQMHYGRDDVVITTSLFVIVGGILLTQVCGRLLSPRPSG